MGDMLLHIGIHKTGTTSIQRYLAFTYKDLLDEGVLYPVAGRSRPYAGHHLLAWSILGIHGIQTDQCWYDVLAEIRSCNPKLAIISAEGFETCNQHQIQAIRQYLQDESVKVVVYLRNQLDFMLSDYKEMVKTAGYFQPFRVYLESHYQRCDYGSLLSRWGDVFGTENIIVRSFDKVKRNPGLLKDFLGIAGIDGNISPEEQKLRANVSPPDAAIKLLTFSKRFASVFGKTVSASFERSILRSEPKGRALLFVSRILLGSKIYSAKDVVWLKNKVAGWNQEFLNEFIDPVDHRHYEF